MRLFTGISISPPAIEALRGLLKELKSAAPLKWSPIENLHITTKFVGSWPEERLSELTTALGNVPAPKSFNIAVSKLGFLPNPHRPRTLLAGIQAGPELSDLAHATEDALVTIGCSRKARKYTPHITLARIKDEDIRGVRERIASMTDLNFGSFEATQFHLYESRPGPRGSTYTILQSFPLGAEASA